LRKCEDVGVVLDEISRKLDVMESSYLDNARYSV
jgi:uncharacterized protein YfkK (UPF0435 family)